MFLVLFLLTIPLGSIAQNTEAVQKLDTPIAYCLSTLDECTPEKQKKFEGAAPGDLREVNGGTQVPVTLVYNLPVSASTTNYAVMVAPRKTNNCLRFDTVPAAVCTERELTQINIPMGAHQLFSQAVQISDVRIWPPNMVFGTTQGLQAQSRIERDTIKLLTGWYLFIGLAALFQLLTQRNRQLSVCLALLMVGVILRINTSISSGFSGIVFISPEVSRVVEFLTLPFLSVFLLHYYARLVGNYLRRTRLSYYALCTIASAIILLAQKPEHILLSLKIAQILAAVCLVLCSTCIVKAVRKLERRQSFTLVLGVGAVLSGVSVDIYLNFQNIPQFAGLGVAPFGMAIEAMCQYILVALRNDAAHHEAHRLQTELVASLQNREEELKQKVSERTAELVQKNKLLETLSISDRLTGLNNRLRLDQVLVNEHSRTTRYGGSLSIVLLDVDHFKSVNDTYGHLVGDKVLIEVAQTLRKSTRAVDVVGRWGGEEFLIVCPDTTLEGAKARAEKLRALIALQAFPEVGAKTASFGVASLREGETIDNLIARTDAALYRAKHNGRNRVECEE